MKLEVLIPTGPVLEAEVDKLVAEAANGSFCVKPRQELAYAFEHCLLLGNGLCFHSFTSFNGSKCRSRAPPATGIVLASQRIQRTQGGHVPRTDLEDIEVSRLTGKQVLTQDGREIGDLRTMCLDLSSWRVTSVRVRLRRALLEELTLDRPLVGTQRVTIPVDAISGITDAIVLRSTMPELVELLQREGATSEPDEDQDAEDEETGAGTD